jgi:hypothetical protein
MERIAPSGDEPQGTDPPAAASTGSVEDWPGSKGRERSLELEGVMRTRRPWKAGAIALTLMILLSATSSAGTRWGASFSTLSGGKMIAGGIAQAFAPEAMAAGGPSGMAARTLAAPDPKPTGDCNTDECIGIALKGFGDVSGVGNATGGKIRMEVTADGLVVCTNNGGNAAPGINLPGLTLDGEDGFGSNEVSNNGKVNFETITSTEDIGTILLPATAHGCPSDTWTATLVGYQFLSATMIAFQLDENGNLLEIGRQTFDF